MRKIKFIPKTIDLERLNCTQNYIEAHPLVPAEIKQTLLEFADTPAPEVFHHLQQYEGVFSQTTVFLDGCASVDFSDEEADRAFQTQLPQVISEWQSYQQMMGGNPAQMRVWECTEKYFSDLSAATPETQKEWASALRQQFLEARRQLSEEVAPIEAELQSLLTPRAAEQYNSLSGKMIAVSRSEWVALVPHINEPFDMDQPLEQWLPEQMRRHVVLSGFLGMRTFPVDRDESGVLTVLQPFIRVEKDGTVAPDFNLELPRSAQRHEAAHLMDQLEIEELVGEPDCILARMGFRSDVFNRQERKMVRVGEDPLRATLEEGWATLFQHRFAEQITPDQYTSSDYTLAAGAVFRIMEKIGRQEFVEARMTHDFERIAALLPHLFASSELDSLREIGKRLNTSLVNPDDAHLADMIGV